MLWMYFVVVTLLFQLLAKHSSAALPCKRFVTNVCKHVNDSSGATPLHTQIVSFAIVKLFSLLNIRTRAIIFSARPASLQVSMNELTTEYWNSYVIWNSFINVLYFKISKSEE